MRRIFDGRFGRESIRARVLAIALIPSLTLLIAAVGWSSHQIEQGLAAKNQSAKIQAASGPALEFFTQVSEERRLSLLALSGDLQDPAELGQQRQRTAAIAAKMAALVSAFADAQPVMRGFSDQLNSAIAQVPGIRQGIDARAVSQEQVATLYNQLASMPGVGLEELVHLAPDPETAAGLATEVSIFQALDAMARSNALAAGAISSGGLTENDLRRFRHDVSYYHAELELLQSRLTAQDRGRYNELATGSEWALLTTVENALINQERTRDASLPASFSLWQSAAATVTTGLLNLYTDHLRRVQQIAAVNGQQTFVNSLLGGIGLLVLAFAVLVIAARLAERLVKRLAKLRAQTLELADEQLPRIVERLRDGRAVDPETEVPWLDYGPDEIGQVANAFNKAQRTAVSAAAQEAKTREGMVAVFLSIARRSQLLVRRQLEVLDQAERKQEDPTHLELLFRLDHLTTRARRNAENLVILGGERPGRRWREPVPLEEIIRSAVSETENFTRVDTTQLPEISMESTIVADLMHLLAELIDNATSFSPQKARVKVRGNLVGKGVVIEVDDQGLGIEPDERHRLNTMLHNPPDFDLMALSTQTGMGLFVVARLAARHGITVTLADSDYGGILAIVLVPRQVIAQKPQVLGHTFGSGTTASTSQLSSARHATPSSDNAATTSLLGRYGSPLSTPPSLPPARVDQRGNGQHAKEPLPRRRRQTHLEPKLATDMAYGDNSAPLQPQDRSADRARNTASAMLRGTRRGRHTGAERPEQQQFFDEESRRDFP
ncbi:sensor histidine kinase [Nocardia vinacea]|uniref:histidine kinase n=1 Tax=Nocardia vinacea TaxID=96468 RepID=A0ABZ1YU29_9NOCA|nr:sensor histidine kinase [Nocardia vinacea]